MGFNLKHTMKSETFTSLLILETVSYSQICLEPGGILFLFTMEAII